MDSAPVIVLRVVIRSPDVETFVEKYSRFVKDDRIFIFTKSSQPMGTRVRFTLQLADAGTALLVGQGVVTRVRQDTGDPGKPPGMEVKFTPLGDDSARMVQRMLARRAEELASAAPSPSPPPPIPTTPPLPPSQPVPLPPPPSLSLEGAAPVVVPPERAETTERNSASPPVVAMEADPGSEEASTLVRDPASTAGPTPLPAPLPLPPILTPPFGSEPHSLRSTANGSGVTPLPPHAPAGSTVAPSLPVLHYTAPSLPALAEAATRDESSAPPSVAASGFGGAGPSSVTNATVPARLSASGRVVVEPAPSLPVLDGTSPAMSALDDSDTTDRVAPLAGRSRRAESEAKAADDDHVVEQAPRVLESWIGPLPAPPGAPPASSGMVPANPFSDISDGAIEYFIEWSVEQSRQTPDKKLAAPKAKFGGVSMKPPRAERKPRPPWVVMVTGIVLGIVVGVPAGGLAMWRYRAALTSLLGLGEPVGTSATPTPVGTTATPTPATATGPKAAATVVAPAPAAEGAPPTPTTTPIPTTTTTPPTATPTAPPTETGGDVEGRNLSGRPRPTTMAPDGDEAERDKLRAAGKLAMLRVRSTPDGGEVTVKGTSAPTGRFYGTTPIEIELAPGHRYDVVVTLDGYPPFKRRINLLAPATEVMAKFK